MSYQPKSNGRSWTPLGCLHRNNQLDIKSPMDNDNNQSLLTIGLICIGGGIFWGAIHSFENLGFVALALIAGVGLIIGHVTQSSDKPEG
jgi:hypothetical protein